MNPRSLSRFSVGGLDKRGDPTGPVQITCGRCGTAHWRTYRDDGGADRSTDLGELVMWAEGHTCAPPSEGQS